MYKFKCKSCGTELNNIMKYVDFIDASENWFTHYSPFSVWLLLPNTKEWKEKTIEGLDRTFSSIKKIETPHGMIENIIFVDGLPKPRTVLA